jgi:hypothetical protein
MPLVLLVVVLALSVVPAVAQESDVARLREEIELLKARLAQIEAVLDASENAGTARATAATRPVAAVAPALNTPPQLPPSSAEAFAKTPPRIDVLMQAARPLSVTRYGRTRSECGRPRSDSRATSRPAPISRWNWIRCGRMIHFAEPTSGSQLTSACT